MAFYILYIRVRAIFYIYVITVLYSIHTVLPLYHMYQFVCLFLPSFPPSFVYLFIHLFICLFIHLFTHSFIYLFIYTNCGPCHKNRFNRPGWVTTLTGEADATKLADSRWWTCSCQWSLWYMSLTVIMNLLYTLYLTAYTRINIQLPLCKNFPGTWSWVSMHCIVWWRWQEKSRELGFS